jgi:hypothetical protein
MRLGGWHGHGVARPSEGDFSSDRGRNPSIKLDPLPEFGQNLLPNWCGDTAAAPPAPQAACGTDQNALLMVVVQTL